MVFMTIPDLDLPKHGEHWIHYKNPDNVYKILGISVDCDDSGINQRSIDGWCLEPDDINTPIAIIDTLQGYVLYDGSAVLPDFVIYRSYSNDPMEKHSTWCRHKDEFMKIMDDGNGTYWNRFSRVQL